MDPTGTKNYSNVLACLQFGVLGFASLALGKCSKQTLPNGGDYGECKSSCLIGLLVGAVDTAWRSSICFLKLLYQKLPKVKG